MGWAGKLYLDEVVLEHIAAFDHDCHHPAFADQLTIGVAVEHGGGQSALVAIQLTAGIAQAGDLDDGRFAQRKPCALGQGQYIQSARGDVLAQGAGIDTKPGCTQLIEQLGMNQVNLAQIGLMRICGRASDAAR